VNPESILNNPGVRVIPQSRASLVSGVSLYGSRPDTGYSLTDCVSMQNMRREGITEVLTNDRHFEQEGFRACSGNHPRGPQVSSSTPKAVGPNLLYN